MTQDRIDAYLIANQKYFPPEKMMILRDKLAALDDSRASALTCVELKDPTTMIIISIVLGSLGIDRFMLGDTGMGVLKLLTAGCCGVLTIIDWCTIMNKTREMNFANLMAVL